MRRVNPRVSARSMRSVVVAVVGGRGGARHHGSGRVVVVRFRGDDGSGRNTSRRRPWRACQGGHNTTAELRRMIVTVMA